MIGILYLILCFTVGYVICTYAFPSLTQLVETDYLKRKISVSPYIALIPAWYVTGTLVLTWATYLLGYAFRNADKPLFYANAIVIPVAILITAMVVYLKFIKAKQNKLVLLSSDKKAISIEIIFVMAVALLACVLMWTTFFIKDNKLYIGVSVFSDFSPHVGMIRSFSYGNNFPTTYPHFAGQDIRYHFMFQFLTGNLEYLGLPIDYAFNLPSIISFICAFFLLYLLAIKITSKIGAGILACLFFAFRSSKTLFTYIAGIPKGTSLWDTLSQNTNFISSTPNEDWGLWNLNVYCNQRHLAFGLATFFLVVLLFIPQLYEMFEDIKQNHFMKSSEDEKDNTTEGLLRRLLDQIRVIFFTKEAWVAKDYKTAVAAGILLGSLSFFHGAAVIGCLTVLFVIAVLAKRRIEFLITAVIAVLLSTLQTNFFIHGSVVSTQYLFGFIAENKTFFGAASYIERLLGLLPLVLLVAICLEKGVGRWLLLAFSAPFIFAFTISLTIDVTVNHKYIMMSCILLGIFAAAVVMKLFEQKDLIQGFIAILLIVMLTSTGVYDLTTVLKKNQPEAAIVLELDHPVTNWINENSRSQDIFLSSYYAINQVVLGGAMLYEGWPYFAWSAGYDTNYRSAMVKQMYEATTPDALNSLATQEKIRYIIVDQDNRNSTEYIINEDNIKATYECVYQTGEGEWQVSIYDTQKPIYK